MNSSEITTEIMLVKSLIDSQQFLLALPRALELVKKNPQSGECQYLLAWCQVELGKEEEALKTAELAISLAPRNFDALYLCGKLYSHFDLYEYALPLLRRSIEVEPRASLSQFELGHCYLKMGLAERSIIHFKTALKLLPSADVKEDIRDGLAAALVEVNKPHEALPILKRIAESRYGPAVPSALISLASIERALPGSKLYKTILDRLDDDKYNDWHKRQLWLAAARCHVNKGEHDVAFSKWQKAAEYGRKVYWHPRDYAQIFSETTGFYNKSLFKLCKEHSSTSEIPVFIAGMPRSGTTLTEQIIGAHSKADGVGELGRWASLDAAFRNDYRVLEHEKAIEKNGATGELRVRAEETLNVFQSILGELPHRVVEKLPHSFMYMGYQALMFANARFIHIRRHPADSFISNYQINLSGFHSYGFDQTEYAREYVFHENLMTHWKSIFGDRILTVQYENLATNPEPEARRIIDFIGLPWEDGCLEFYKRNATVRTFSTQQVRQPVYTSSVERWRVYEKHLGPLFQALDEMGISYPPEN